MKMESLILFNMPGPEPERERSRDRDTDREGNRDRTSGAETGRSRRRQGVDLCHRVRRPSAIVHATAKARTLAVFPARCLSFTGGQLEFGGPCLFPRSSEAGCPSVC